MFERFFGQTTVQDEYAKHYVKNFAKYSLLSKNTRKTLEKLWKYELPQPIIERLRKKFPFNFMQHDEILICIDEFKKYMAIQVIGRSKNMPVSMTSNMIDEIWHQFILFTIEYHQFSKMLNSEFIHHTPNTKKFSFGPNAAEFFFSTYKDYFGDLHPIWNFTIAETMHETKKQSPLLLVLSELQNEDNINGEYFGQTIEYKLDRKGNQKTSFSILGPPAGHVNNKDSMIACGGILCGGFATNHALTDSSSVNSSSSDEGGSDGGCGGCGCG